MHIIAGKTRNGGKVMPVVVNNNNSPASTMPNATQF